ncbi:MAG: transporter related protein [Xanthobacteraceae bacterium]|jgi:ABC-type lipoprotein export system ATPase subunit|nr:transporter related protein [Xanthobacteraceae bacterium]
MLACRSLVKRYSTDKGPVEAIRGIDLDVATGRYAAIVGRSGSGKSSLMGMIGGLSSPTAGQVLVDGIDIWMLSDAAAASFRNARIGYIFQFASLLPTLRAIDNVALPAQLAAKRSRGEIFELAARRLADVGLDTHHDAFPSELSSGEQRRVVIARALMNEPALLLADEPTSDLDEQTEREIMALLLAINRQRGTTLVLVTHNLALAAEADQIVQIANGVLAP